MSTPLWPGDVFNPSFQVLQYNSTTQILAISPYGNSVSLETPGLQLSSITTDYLGISTALFLVDTIAGPKVATGAGLALNFLPEPAVSTIDGVLNVGFSNAAVTMYNFASNGFTYWNVGKNTNGDAEYGIGADAGSNFKIDRLNPAGSAIDTPLVINHTDGSVNVNVLNTSSITGVQSINGISQITTQWINPGAPIQVSTLGSATTLIPAISFSTIAGHTYQVNFEYGSSNVGGGAASDETTIPITTDGGGHVYIADSFITDQTYGIRYATPCAIIYSPGSNATINVANDTAGGNVQLVNFYRLWTRDLGVSANQY